VHPECTIASKQGYPRSGYGSNHEPERSLVSAKLSDAPIYGHCKTAPATTAGIKLRCAVPARLGEDADTRGSGAVRCLLAAYRQTHKENVKNATKIRKNERGKTCSPVKPMEAALEYLAAQQLISRSAWSRVGLVDLCSASQYVLFVAIVTALVKPLGGPRD
jgi:hypothetical protein